jgi:hypothetical protein
MASSVRAVEVRLPVESVCVKVGVGASALVER